MLKLWICCGEMLLFVVESMRYAMAAVHYYFHYQVVYILPFSGTTACVHSERLAEPSKLHRPSGACNMGTDMYLVLAYCMKNMPPPTTPFLLWPKCNLYLIWLEYYFVQLYSTK